MGHVVSFTPKTGRSSGRPVSASEAGAIIIFPGVRYERVPEADKTSASTAVARKPKH